MRLLSVVPVVVLSATLAACGRQPPPPEAQAASPSAPAGASAEDKAFLALLPVTGAATNWSQVKEPRRYGQGDLWEYINGAAEQYLAFDFQDLATAGYAHVSIGVDATADLYRMADAVNAFGIYAEERSASCEPVTVGVEGCYSGGTLSFYSGAYFVKLTAFKDTADVKQALLVLATALAGRLGAPGAPPAQLAVFPPKNLVPGSAKYVPKDVLGQSFLSNAFEAQYQDGPSSYKLLVIGFDAAGTAADGLAQYKAFIGAGGKITGEFKTPGNGGFTGTDSFYGTVCTARSGTSVLIALGVPSEKAGLALIQACVTRLR